MLTYKQSTGELSDASGQLIATGYSGAALGKNNPALENVRNVGPAPVGVYDITGPECVGPFPCAQCGGHDAHHHGPFVLRLHPRPENEMYGRAGFLCHGDNPTHTASQGCIIMPRPVRELLAAKGGDSVLRVVHGAVLDGMPS